MCWALLFQHSTIISCTCVFNSFYFFQLIHTVWCPPVPWHSESNGSMSANLYSHSGINRANGSQNMQKIYNTTFYYILLSAKMQYFNISVKFLLINTTQTCNFVIERCIYQIYTKFIPDTVKWLIWYSKNSWSWDTLIYNDYQMLIPLQDYYVNWENEIIMPATAFPGN